MGIYLNPKNKGFWESLHSEIYVDKTGMIAYINQCLNTEQKFICVSRPRRFGKSMALKMLSAYYSKGADSKELFAGCKIAGENGFAEHLNQHNVIYLNMQQFLNRTNPYGDSSYPAFYDYVEQRVKKELQREFDVYMPEPEAGLSDMLLDIYAETDEQFIFLIDEWDCVMRERAEDQVLQKQYLDFLRNLLKDQEYVALAYMTGILPVKKYGSHSALNMFREFSMANPMQLEEYAGFTETEVKELCIRYGMDAAQAKRWYDGYMFSRYLHVYNPKAVVEAMLSGRFLNFWTSTETYEALKKYIDLNYDGLREAVTILLGNGRIAVNTGTFQNDMKTFESKDDVLTLLVHLGYLAFDMETKEVYIPNMEIRTEFENAMRVSGWTEVMRVIEASDRLLEETLAGNAVEVAEALDAAHEEVSSVLTYNDENSLSCAVSLAYYSARRFYRMVREFPAGKGFADIVFIPWGKKNKPAILVELKYDHTAKGAITQIKEKKYINMFDGYSGEILLVGINYEKKTKKHSCIIERYEP